MTVSDPLARARAQYAAMAAPASSLDEARLAMEAALADDPIPAGVSVSPGRIGGISVERIVPDAAKRGALIYAHGGGYIAGSLITHRALAAEIAAATGRTVITVDYRRAPEHFFPAAVEDMAAVFEAVRDELARAPVALGGDSAGGGLAVSTVAMLRDESAPLPDALVLIGPWIDLKATGKSYETNRALDPIVTVETMVGSAAAYVGAGDPDHPWLNPLRSSLKGFPPTLIQVGDAETLLSDAEALAEKARADGVDLSFELWPDMMHTWHRYAAYLPQAREALSAIGVFLDRTLD